MQNAGRFKTPLKGRSSVFLSQTPVQSQPGRPGTHSSLSPGAGAHWPAVSPGHASHLHSLHSCTGLLLPAIRSLRSCTSLCLCLGLVFPPCLFLFLSSRKITTLARSPAQALTLGQLSSQGREPVTWFSCVPKTTFLSSEYLLIAFSWIVHPCGNISICYHLGMLIRYLRNNLGIEYSSDTVHSQPGLTCLLSPSRRAEPLVPTLCFISVTAKSHPVTSLWDVMGVIYKLSSPWDRISDT